MFRICWSFKVCECLGDEYGSGGVCVVNFWCFCFCFFC